MPSEETMENAVSAYVARLSAGDLDGVVALFASDASVEDPVGTPPRVGHAALREFFGVAVSANAKLVLDGPIRTASNYAAFPFHVILDWQGRTTRIDVIDVFQFDEHGKIAEMRAFFGSKNSAAVTGA